MNHTEHTDQMAQRILHDRARALAQVDAQADTTHGEETVVFRLGTATYGIAARFVREIHALHSYTALAATPPCIVGLVNVRGKLLTALDVRPLLDLPSEPPHVQAMLLLVSVQEVNVGILADAVLEVRHADRDLSPALSAGTGRTAPWVRGVDHQLNLILDPVGLLHDTRLIVNYIPE